MAEKVEGEKIGRSYAQAIENGGPGNIRPSFEKYIEPNNTQVKTDGRRGYWALDGEF